MTAKEKLPREILDFDGGRAARVPRIVVADERAEDREAVTLPDDCGDPLTGEPMPDVAGAVRRSRDSH